MNLAPILLFAFKRNYELKQTVEALRNNLLAKESNLYIFSDAAKTQTDQPFVLEVRKYIKTIQGFKNIHIVESEKNKGLANSIIDGVTQIINTNEKVIVLEDDLLTSPNFLVYMNHCLDRYSENKKVFSISGYTFPIANPNSLDIYFTKRGSSWGWATWKDRWVNIDWQINDYYQFKNNKNSRKKFNEMGSDMANMLDKQMNNKMDSWAIRWCYNQFKNNQFTVYPFVSKVKNIGFSDGATHTFDIINRYDTVLDNSSKVIFKLTDPYLDNSTLKKFISKYSIYTRVKYKILNKIAALKNYFR